MLTKRSLPVLIIALGLVFPALAQVLEGRARVVDGDTLEIAGVTVRLHGIDAPEAGQPCTRAGRAWDCGGWAAGTLAELIGGRSVACRGVDTDRYGRTVAVCRAGRVDLNAEMVRIGAAFAYREFSLDYVEAEKDALFAERGIWSGEVELPAVYRANLRAAAAAANERTSPPGCQIKGNISGSGRIYHMPGQENYADTRIDERRGERWFCSEAEARAAGWRRARR